MTVAAILKHKGHQVTTVVPTATIAEVAEVLATHRIGAALVMDRADQLLGIISERDIVRSLAANGGHTLEMTAGHRSAGPEEAAHEQDQWRSGEAAMESGGQHQEDDPGNAQDDANHRLCRGLLRTGKQPLAQQDPDRDCGRNHRRQA